ncbi:MAG: thioredoxin family protein [archaeon]|nr:thioredoxin family protein [archaeon]
MVMFQSNKHVFWQALVFTIVIFGIGVILGYFLESQRAEKLEFNLMNSEVNMVDEQLRYSMLQNSNISCDLAVKSIFAFADKIYGEAQRLEKYDSSTQFSRQVMISMHKRYDLLRIMLWNEAISTKTRCKSFHTVTYFFDYSTEDAEKRGEQAFYGRLLTDLKNAYPNEILLIPIASNLDIASIELAKEVYGISSTPSIVIDEKKIVSEVVTLEELEKEIFGATFQKKTFT